MKVSVAVRSLRATTPGRHSAPRPGRPPPGVKCPLPRALLLKSPQPVENHQQACAHVGEESHPARRYPNAATTLRDRSRSAGPRVEHLGSVANALQLLGYGPRGQGF